MIPEQEVLPANSGLIFNLRLRFSAIAKNGAARFGLPFALLFACLPPLLAAYYIRTYGVNVIQWDEWDLVKFFDSWYSGTLTLKELFAQHNEHRTFFGRLFLMGLGHLTHLNTKAAMWASFGALCLLALLLYRLTTPKGTNLKTAIIRFVPISWLVFNWNQSENLLWGFQFQLVLMVLAVAVAVYGLTRSTGLDRFFWLAVISGIVASYSFANGLLIWPVGLAQILWQRYWRGNRGVRLFRPQALSWSLIAGAVYALYLFDYKTGPQHPSMLSFLQHPLLAVGHFLVYLGTPLGTDLNSSMAMGALLLTVYGCLAVALLANLSLLPTAQRDQLSGGFSLLLFTLLSGGMLMLGRAGFGLESAAASRYVTFSSLGLVAGLALVRLVKKDSARWVLQGIFIAALSIGVLTSYGRGHRVGELQQQKLGEAAFFVRSHRCQPDDRLRWIMNSAESIRTNAPLLEKYRLNVFYRRPPIICPALMGSAQTLKQTQTDYAVDVVNGVSGAGLQNEISVDLSRDKSIQFTGWAVDREAEGPASGVAISVEGKDGWQDFPAQYDLGRFDVAQAFAQPTYQHCGFVASLPTEKLTVGKHRLRLKIITADRQQYYQPDRVWMINIQEKPVRQEKASEARKSQ